LDHTANHYLALAATIALGVKGLTDKLVLPEPYLGDPATLKKEERLKLGIQELPSNLKERTEIIMSEEGKPLREFFGEVLIRNILSTYEEDHHFFEGKTIEDEVQHLVQRY
jgi:glutamine synthetase